MISCRPITNKARYESTRQDKNFTIKREKLPDTSELIQLSNYYMLNGRDYVVSQKACLCLATIVMIPDIAGPAVSFVRAM